MIVVDSSIFIDNLRNVLTPGVMALRSLERTRRIRLGDIVLMEVLRGARDNAHAARIRHDLERFPVVNMMNEAVAVHAADSYRRLRRLGITVHSTVEVIIATYCIDHGHELLHDDRDFLPMVEHLGLRECGGGLSA